MTRMRDEQEREREALENAMAALARAQILLDAQVGLRLRQASVRWPGELLTGAADAAAQAAGAVERAQRYLGQVHRLRAACGWECSSKERE